MQKLDNGEVKELILFHSEFHLRQDNRLQVNIHRCLRARLVSLLIRLKRTHQSGSIGVEKKKRKKIVSENLGIHIFLMSKIIEEILRLTKNTKRTYLTQYPRASCLVC